MKIRIGSGLLLAVFAAGLCACNLKEELERTVEGQAAAVLDQVAQGSDGVSIAQGIPEGYPVNEIPVYGAPDSDVLGGFRQTVDGVLMFNLVVGTDHDTRTVEERIRETFEERSTDFEILLGGMLMGVIGEWEYAVVVGDGTADNYATLITYTVKRI